MVEILIEKLKQLKQFFVNKNVNLIILKLNNFNINDSTKDVRMTTGWRPKMKFYGMNKTKFSAIGF